MSEQHALRTRISEFNMVEDKNLGGKHLFLGALSMLIFLLPIIALMFFSRYAIVKAIFGGYGFIIYYLLLFLPIVFFSSKGR